MPEWKDTVNLPRTDFPMKANLPTSEPDALARWKAIDLYGKIRAEREGAQKFVLHDGPPYTSGAVCSSCTSTLRPLSSVVARIGSL